MIRRAVPVLVLAVLAGCGGDDDPADPVVTIATRNLFLGSGLEALFDPSTAANLPATVRVLHDEVRASDPPGRMAKVADELATRRPHLVALQEAALFRTAATPVSAEVVEYDYVDLLLAALRARGAGYRLVSAVDNFDMLLPDGTGLVRFVDRDAILAREDVPTRDPAAAHFAQILEVPFGLLSVGIPRGWCAITADVAGTTVRLVNTHLEAVNVGGVREDQARELVALLAGEARHALLAGDFNSPPAEASGASGILRGAGWIDPWDALHPGDPGLTCCFDTGLRTADSLETRIDLVLYRGPFTPEASEVVGEEAADRTAGGLWPSDHAGVVTRLRTP